MKIAQKEIEEAFQSGGQRVFTRRDLRDIFVRGREFWRLAKSITAGQFVRFLLTETQLHEVRLGLRSGGALRYVWGDVSPYVLVQSLRSDGYFTHFTAVELHGLSDQVPKVLYFNEEQAPKRTGKGVLEQRRIDAAFRRPARRTTNMTEYNGYRIVILNGMYTGRLGVTMERLEGEGSFSVTGLERTLIDIAVRPFYSGGVAEVLRVYKAAGGRVAVNKLAAMLRNLGYVYPYHQAIGFYLDKSGVFSDSEIRLLQEFPMEIDFYLDYQMGENVAYSDKWRLFFPRELDMSA